MSFLITKTVFRGQSLLCRALIDNSKILANKYHEKVRLIYSNTLIIYKYKHFIFNQVIDHYENPRNVGSLNKTDEDVGTGLVGGKHFFDKNFLIKTQKLYLNI